MSSAGIAEVEMAAVGAMLALSAALGGTGLVLQGAGNLATFVADRLQEQADAKQARREQAQRYEQLVREVLDRHARIDALVASARRAEEDRGVTAELGIPEPLRFEGQDPAWLEAWCARTDVALDAAQHALSEAIAAAMTAELMAGTGAVAGVPVLVTDAVSAAPVSGESRAELAVTLARVLARLSPDTIAADVKAVREAAAQVAGAPTADEAVSRLTDVRIRVQQANEKAKVARDDTIRAARCLRGLTGCQSPDADAVRAALAAVVAGRAGLDERLLARAGELAAQAQAELERQYLAAALVAALDGLGYQLGEGFETLTAQDGDVFITRGDWPAHAVKVKLGEDHELRFAMVRTQASASRQDQFLDAEREQSWCASFEQVRAVMAERGVGSAVRWLLEPGTQQLPVTSRRPVRAPAARHRERPGSAG